MTSAQGAYGTLSWTYDAVGNRLSQQKTSGTTTNQSYTYAANSNRLQSVTDGGTARGFSYTPVGNVSLDDWGAAADLTFTSNAANRLAVIAAPSGTVATMVYDGLGRRITRQEGSATARYHYDAEDRLIAISDSIGNWTETIWLEDLPVAQATGSNLVAIHTDQIGQPARMTNSSGAIVWSRTAQPFGETYAESGAIATVLRFPGQVADATTQTHYNMARDYDPSLGRYLQSDPIGLDGGWNTYGYVGGNPVSQIDPEGLSPAAIRGAVVVGEVAGDGLIWWCRANLVLCLRTVGPPAIQIARACNSITEDLSGSILEMAGHKKGKRKSTKPKHEEGDARRGQDYGGEKGDDNRRPPRRPPGGKTPKGGWPPKHSFD